MSAVDEPVEGDEVVRSFMATRGRTRTNVEELSIETMVSAPPAARRDARRLDPQQRRVLERAASATSVAELSADLGLPLRTAVIIVSEMVAAGVLDAHTIVDVIDTSFLSRIRTAFEEL